MMKMHRNALSVAVVLALSSLALSGCGGGGGTKSGSGGTTVPPFTPTIATDATLTNIVPPTIAAEPAPATFSDPNLAQMHVLINDAGALGAGKIGTGVKIGFLDTGIDHNNPALAGRVQQPEYINVDPSTNNTAVDDVVGHGTIVASLAAGKPMAANYLDTNNNVVGTSTWQGGVAQGATVISSRIIEDNPPPPPNPGQGGTPIGAGQGYGTTFQQLNAQLADAGAKIINNSWGGLYWNDPALSVELQTAWKDFVVNRGGLVVFASGNDGATPALLPNPSDNAMLPSKDGGDAVLAKGWITVGALDPAKPTQLTSYSQQCGVAMNYCMVAPGDVVIAQHYNSTSAYGLYNGSGTSFSAPQVSGAAAVVWAQFPYFNNDLVRQTLLGTAKDLGAPGVDPVFGWGLLDVTKAANGPGNFAWGDVTVSFSGNSIWRNSIVGAGGLIKQGSGTLTLTQAQGYTGATSVQGGALDIRQGLGGSALSISSGAQVFASGTFGQSVGNAGFFVNGRDAGSTINGNYTQSGTGNLGIWLGTPLQVNGTASIAGQLSLLGTRTGYTTQAKENLLKANGGLSGTFAAVKAAPNVFLDATVGYDANNAFLNINRINVTAAAVSLGLPTTTIATATRVEGAMTAIDGQLASGVGAIPTGFINGAAAIQQTPNAQVAERTLSSLSGQLQAASATMTLESLDAGRHALDRRFASLSNDALLKGAWTQDLQRDGTLAQSGLNSIGLDVSGTMSGYDQRIGRDAVVGMAMSQTRLNGWMNGLGDRARGNQAEAQMYAGLWRDGWFAFGSAGAGRFDRRTDRLLQLGLQVDGASALQRGNYLFADVEGGYRFALSGLDLTPYVGTQYASIRNDGFRELDASGFGLQANTWRNDRWQGYAGLRASHDWRLANGWRFGMEARGEFQQLLHGNDTVLASFTGVEQWSPVTGFGLARQGSLFGLGFTLDPTKLTHLRFDLSQRNSSLGNARTWMAMYERLF
ncbi:S8 family serine peptidase [Solilutibacter silvestris]|uniref:Autotransporter-associated beta strand repeat-containing protein n=1 Tax=Solilutibacter silvestris TaxID=1645665 RepID=A0A2K1PZW0_9GAMM|nr:S8 family serine peptidase [Lysobacter silvestris]PNS08325.1 autotransporter-associated beta strand repeat-containing protein [Lysobacter silvestris]